MRKPPPVEHVERPTNTTVELTKAKCSCGNVAYVEILVAAAEAALPPGAAVIENGKMRPES
jgi:hypothetical protein